MSREEVGARRHAPRRGAAEGLEGRTADTGEVPLAVRSSPLTEPRSVILLPGRWGVGLMAVVLTLPPRKFVAVLPVFRR